LWWCAGDDFEYQVPCTADKVGFQPMSLQSGDDITLDHGATGGDLVSEVIGNQPFKSLSTQYSQTCIGESFASVKQLLNRYTQLLFSTTLPTLSATNGLLIWPWLSGLQYLVAVTKARAVPNVGGDAYGYFSPMYAYYRGSVRIKVSPPNTTSVQSFRMTLVSNLVKGAPLVVDVGAPVIVSANILDWTISNTTLGVEGISSSDVGPGMTIAKVPYYNQTKFSLLLHQTTSNNCPTDISQPEVLLAINGAGTTLPIIHRSFGEDFQMMMFLGAPPVFWSYI